MSSSSRNSAQSDEPPQATRNHVARASRCLAGAKLRVSIAERIREYLPTLKLRSTVEQKLMDTSCGAALDQVRDELTAAQETWEKISGEYEMFQAQNTHFDIYATDNMVTDDVEQEGSEPICVPEDCVPEDETIKAQYRRVYEAFLAVEKDVKKDFVSESSAQGDPATATHDPAELNRAFPSIYGEVDEFLQAELSRV